jgi:hypothetical protein
MRAKLLLRIFLACVCAVSQSPAQQLPVRVDKPKGPLFVRSYEAANSPLGRVKNSDLLRSLVRGGKLYLTAQDAIAAAIENNLDLQVGT